ncbi:MAG: hypothetical protein AAFX87_02480 [Bacteroidota bacterium]
MIIRNRFLIRFIASFLLITTINYIFLPTFSWALTSGPTAPEATSFEPVDTTDMVNLITGDFTYNMPLLEVPGPAGGYPLSLSYHAGIQPQEEASWVGLGWTLNPGAITRSVNGFPDDFNSITNTERSFWEGGTQTTWNVGVSVGIAGVASVSAGLAFSQDTYQGFGWGGSLGASFSPEKSPLGASASIGISPYGGFDASAGVNVGIGRQIENITYGGSAGVGFSTSGGFSGSAGASVGYRMPTKGRMLGRDNTMSGSLLGASISSSASGTSGGVGVGGGSVGVHNSKSGLVSTSTKSTNVNIPTPFGISFRLGKTTVHYWIDQTTGVKVNGTLFYPENTPEFSENVAFDTYDLPKLGLSFEKFDDPAKTTGGTFPDYDNYSVHSQGLSGNFRPYHFRRILYRQDQKEVTDDADIDKIINQGLHSNQGDAPVYRFIGDFANTYQYDKELTRNSSGQEFIYDFDDAPDPETGVQIDGTHLAGSKYITYFTNFQINNDVGTDGFIDTQSAGFDRRSGVNYNDQIGGFKITNESGVTYHYSLPAYVGDEHIYSQGVDDKDKTTFNNLLKKTAYAYTWYLTGITGPDFVDRGTSGELDEEDWGYWVRFDYGLWTDDYDWRNPAKGFHKDFDTKFENYSKGTKDIYYLNSIRTKSHTALFVKDIRFDGKSVVPEYDKAVLTKTAPPVDVEDVDEGGFDSKSRCLNAVGTGGSRYAKSLMKLEDVYLIQNKDLSQAELTGLLDDSGPTFQQVRTTNTCGDVIRYHLGDNVLDRRDITSAIINKSVRSINFRTDYSLSRNMPNSFVSSLDAEVTDATANEDAKFGRLTLNAVKFYGKQRKSLIPATQFTYGENPDYVEDDFDIWGFYKFNVFSFLASVNESAGRAVSGTSPDDPEAQAWSLKGIGTPLGGTIEVEYQADSYRIPDEYKSYGISIPQATARAGVQDRVRLNFQTGFDPSKVFKVGDEIDFISLEKEVSTIYDATFNPDFPDDNVPVQICDGRALVITQGTPAQKKYVTEVNAVVKTVTTTYLEIDHSLLYDRLNSRFVNNCALEILPQPDDILDFICQFMNAQDPTGTCQFQDVTASHLSGTLTLRSNNRDVLGGGLRVKKLTVKEQDSERSTLYDYNHDGYTSGVTSYEPVKVEQVTDGTNKIDLSRISELDEVTREYVAKVYGERTARILAHSRDIPGPGVFYKYVTVKEQIKDLRNNSIHTIPQYSEYEFEVFDPNYYQVVDTKDGFATGTRTGTALGTEYKASRYNNVTVKDLTARIGLLKKVTLYDANHQPISETENGYLHDSIDPTIENIDTHIEEYKETLVEPLSSGGYDGQGYLEENFANARLILKEEGDLENLVNEGEYYMLAVKSKREYYPAIPTYTKNINHTTGITTRSDNLAFDYYTGVAIKTKVTDSYGNSFVTETTPAYTVYDGMGLGAKNMLIQEAASQTYRINDAGSPVGLVAASIQTWTDDVSLYEHPELPTQAQGIFKKHKSYQWIGNGSESLMADGLFQYNEFEPFTSAHWNGTQSPPDQWQKNSEITRYDVYSHALEAKDINGNYAATKMDVKEEKVLATVANARYQEFAYSGAEEQTKNGYFGGNVKLEGALSSGYGHTGSGFVQSTASSRKGFSYQAGPLSGGTYRVSFWGAEESESSTPTIKYKISGGATQNVELLPVRFIQRGSDEDSRWYLIRGDIEVPQNASIEVWTEGVAGITLHDDFRFHPRDAAMTAYVYNQWGELSHILDQNNLYTRFEYDEMGKLKATFKETFQYGEVETGRHDYQYCPPQENFTASLEVTTLNNPTRTGDLVTFTLTPTYEGDNFRYRWIFNNGETNSSSNRTISRVFNSFGNYEVYGRVEDIKTGVFFETEPQDFFINSQCADEGQPAGFECEVDANDCPTGRVRELFTNGECGTMPGPWFIPDDPVDVLCFLPEPTGPCPIEPEF